MTWHIANIRDTNWYQEGPFGVSGNFQRDEHFDEFGFNFAVVWPGQPVAMYHREANQEGFLILAGECLAIVEGEEHPMKQWDYLHCPPATEASSIRSIRWRYDTAPGSSRRQRCHARRTRRSPTRRPRRSARTTCPR